MSNKVTDPPKRRPLDESERARRANEQRQQKRRASHPVSQTPPPNRRPRNAQRPVGKGGPGQREPVRSAVEPQLLERRRQVNEDSRRRLIQRIKVALGVTGVAVLAIAMLFSPLFNLDSVEISGQALLSPKEIEHVSGLVHGSPLVTADVRGAQEALRDNPWIAFAKVRRSYPSTVTVAITEERPQVVVAAKNGTALVSRNGRILEFSTDPASVDKVLTERKLRPVRAEFGGSLLGRSASTTNIRGSHVSNRVLDLVRFTQHLTQPVIERLSLVKMNAKGDVELQLADKSVVLVGPPEESAAKVSAIESVLGQVDLRCLAQIDVRNPTRVTVKRAPGCDLGGE